MKTAIWWVRNDQRIHDQPIFNAVGERYDRLLVVYVEDLSHDEIGPFGFARRGDKRKQWTKDSLWVLNENLKKLGSHLSVFKADTTDQLAMLYHQFDAEIIFAQREYGEEEKDQEESLLDLGLNLELLDTSCLIHPEDLPFDREQLPDTFTPFRKKVEKDLQIRSLSRTPQKLPPNPISINASSFFDNQKPATKSGEDEALKRLKYYLFESKNVSTYKKTRNELLGENFSTRFSLWLANGNISARMIYVALKAYEEQYAANESTYWVFFELLWRDYFKNVWKKHGKWMFRSEGILRKNDVPIGLTKSQNRVFEKWTKGFTGNSFCDAMMRELAETGFLSNRARQICASHLCYDLNIPWIAGAYWFENQLIDYDPCSNYGNWQYISGQGNDPRGGRHFNVEKQRAMYDPDNEYTKAWLS
jgi:deoxyribodipyrimidine photo-lyase